MSRRRVVVLGSTGSIGTQALEVVRAHPDRLEIVGLAAGGDVDGLAAQAEEFGVSDLAVADPDGARRLRERLPGARVRDGLDGVAELAALSDADVVLNSVVGAQGLRPTLMALEAGHDLALANKESLIVGGDLVLAAVGGRRERILPVDSEHSALAQCLRGERSDEVAKVVLTASGGPFRGRRRDDLVDVTVDEALAHPTWEMGTVITINSATLMNKGLELIEAHLLFDIGWDDLEVVIHPQSVVHSMVEFVDGSTLAQLSPPDMRLPIQYALGWPERLPRAFSRPDWSVSTELTFEPADRETFAALDLAEEAGRRGGTYPAVMNAANERAVAAFLETRIGFLDIAGLVRSVLEAADDAGSARGDTATGPALRLEDVLEADTWARRHADELVAGWSAPRATAAPTAPEQGS